MTDTNAANRTPIQWGRILLAAFLMEVLLIVLAIPLFLLGATATLNYTIPPAALAATFGVTLWIGRGIRSRLILHGVLIGIAGTLMYVLLAFGQPEPWQYILAHGLKIVGGAAGGYVLERRRAR